jgi:hypothetical protein
MSENSNDPKTLINAAAQSDPGLAEVMREYYTRQLNPPAPPFKPPSIDFTSAPDLPDWAAPDYKQAASAGQWLDEYIAYGLAVSPMTPAFFHESAALWLASMIIARRLVLKMPYDQVYPNMFVLWLAGTTLYRKSTGLNIALELAREICPFLLAAQDTTPEAFLSDLSGSEPANYSAMTPDEQKIWQQERNFAAQRGWALDEISSLMAGAGRDYNRGLLEALLRFYDCTERYTRSTRGQGRIVVKNSYLSILGATTPAALAEHFAAATLWSNGWWPRFAILTPAERPAWQDATATERPPSLKNGLERLFKRLPNETKFPDPPSTLTVSLGNGVFEAWSKYNRALSHDLLTDDLPEQLHGSYGRLPTQALKVAMILAALDWKENTGAPVIEMPQLARGIMIAETWRASVHRALATASETDFTRTAERVLKVIAKYTPSGGASMREICRDMRDKRPGDIQVAVGELELAGLIQMAERPEKPGRGRPTDRYILAKDD